MAPQCKYGKCGECGVELHPWCFKPKEDNNVKLFLYAFYTMAGVIAVFGWLLPNLINAKSTELNLLGVVLVPLALIAVWRIGRYLGKEYAKKFNKEEDANA